MCKNHCPFILRCGNVGGIFLLPQTLYFCQHSLSDSMQKYQYNISCVVNFDIKGTHKPKWKCEYVLKFKKSNFPLTTHLVHTLYKKKILQNKSIDTFI